jgi:broad specificity phosphatase PhoE
MVRQPAPPRARSGDSDPRPRLHSCLAGGRRPLYADTVADKHRPEIVLVRHGETEWSRARRHTGRTDVPLTEAGRSQALRLAERLAGRRYALVLTSPLARAAHTCRLAGLGDAAEGRPELMEWDYGDYEGRTTRDIRAERPDWLLWRDGCPGGESPVEVGARVDPVVAELAAPPGDVAIFAHGHVLRVLAARWIELPPAAGRGLALSTAGVGILGHEHEARVISLWNGEGRA